MSFEETAGRLWKRLPPEDRLQAATSFWQEPAPDVLGSALGALVKARHMRPQAARALPAETQAKILGSVLDPGETLAASLLVALHLGQRRPLLSTFLDELGLPHEGGILKEEGQAAPITEAAARTAVKALAASYPPSQVLVYLNTLWLQDPVRWEALRQGGDWL